MSATRVAVAALLLQAVLGWVIPGPWSAPDLVLIAVVLAIVRQPQRWVALCALGGFGVSLWTVRAPWATVAWWLALGGLMRWAAPRWDLSTRALQYAVVGSACLGLSILGIGVRPPWTPELIGGMLWHVAVTLLCVPMVSRCVEGRRARSHG